MDYREIIDFLDLEEGKGISYFEHYAHLMESDEEVDVDAIFQLLKSSDKEELLEVNDNYFEEILRIIPEEDTSLYSHIEVIRRYIRGILLEDELSEPYRLSEAIFSFRYWYSVEEQCYINNKPFSLRDGLTSNLLDHIEGNDNSYDFNEFEEFPMDSYFVDLLSLSNSIYEDEDIEE